LEAVGRDRKSAQKHVARAKMILTTAARYGAHGGLGVLHSPIALRWSAHHGQDPKIRA
jgi:hypothetical protein